MYLIYYSPIALPLQYTDQKCELLCLLIPPPSKAYSESKPSADPNQNASPPVVCGGG